MHTCMHSKTLQLRPEPLTRPRIKESGDDWLVRRSFALVAKLYYVLAKGDWLIFVRIIVDICVTLISLLLDLRLMCNHSLEKRLYIRLNSNI